MFLLLLFFIVVVNSAMQQPNVFYASDWMNSSRIQIKELEAESIAVYFTQMGSVVQKILKS